MISEQLAVTLANEVYSTEMLNNNFFDITIGKKHTRYLRLGSIDTSSYLFGGLEAVALTDGEDYLIVVRGADVGIGLNIFQALGANESYIPKSSDDHRLRGSFQDWIWNGLFGTIGLVPFTQYRELKKFYLRLTRDFGHRWTVVGHSLGGEMAQRLSIECKLDAITVSAVSPWWNLGWRARRAYRRGELDDTRIVNIYSRHDPFHYFPLVAKQLGHQKEAALGDFKSTSKLVPMLLERIYWAHGVSHIKFNGEGCVKEKKRYPTLAQKLFKPVRFNWLINLIIIICGMIPMFLSGMILYITMQFFMPELSGELASWVSYLRMIMMGMTLWKAAGAIAAFIAYLLPTLLVRSRWKYFMWILNVGIAWTGLGWLMLVILALLLNSRTRYINKTQKIVVGFQ